MSDTNQPQATRVPYLNLRAYVERAESAVAWLHEQMYEGIHPHDLQQLIFVLVQAAKADLEEFVEPEFVELMHSACGIRRVLEVIIEAYYDSSLLFVYSPTDGWFMLPFATSHHDALTRLDARSPPMSDGWVCVTTNIAAFIEDCAGLNPSLLLPLPPEPEAPDLPSEAEMESIVELAESRFAALISSLPGKIPQAVAQRAAEINVQRLQAYENSLDAALYDPDHERSTGPASRDDPGMEAL